MSTLYGESRSNRSSVNFPGVLCDLDVTRLKTQCYELLNESTSITCLQHIWCFNPTPHPPPPPIWHISRAVTGYLRGENLLKLTRFFVFFHKQYYHQNLQKKSVQGSGQFQGRRIQVNITEKCQCQTICETAKASWKHDAKGRGDRVKTS